MLLNLISEIIFFVDNDGVNINYLYKLLRETVRKIIENNFK